MINKLGIFLLLAISFSFSASAATKEKSDKNVLSKTYEDIKELNETGYYKPHVALMGGVSDPVENGYYASDFLAVETGYQVRVPYAIGLEISTQQFKNDDKSTISQTQIFFKNSYHFAGEVPVIKHSYIGLGLGLVNENERDATVYGAMMPNLGFDIPLGNSLEKISLGANLRYTLTASNRVDNYNLSGVVKYWF